MTESYQQSYHSPTDARTVDSQNGSRLVAKEMIFKCQAKMSILEANCEVNRKAVIKDPLQFANDCQQALKNMRKPGLKRGATE